MLPCKEDSNIALSVGDTLPRRRSVDELETCRGAPPRMGRSVLLKGCGRVSRTLGAPSRSVPQDDGVKPCGAGRRLPQPLRSAFGDCRRGRRRDRCDPGRGVRRGTHVLKHWLPGRRLLRRAHVSLRARRRRAAGCRKGAGRHADGNRRDMKLMGAPKVSAAEPDTCVSDRERAADRRRRR